MNGSPQSQFPSSVSAIPDTRTRAALGRKTRNTVQDTFCANAAVRAGSAARFVRIPKTCTVPAPPTLVPRKQQERQTTLSPAAQRMLAMMLDRYAANVTSRGNATLFALR